MPNNTGVGYFKDLFSKEYILKMMGEENPFNCNLDERERYTYNRGKKEIVVDEAAPNCMKSQLTHNRTCLTKKSTRTHFDLLEIYQELGFNGYYHTSYPLCS